MADWQTLDTAPHTVPPTPVLLFLPNPDRVKPPINVQTVGWWNDAKPGFVDRYGMMLYPSRWQDLPADPVKDEA